MLKEKHDATQKGCLLPSGDCTLPHTHTQNERIGSASVSFRTQYNLSVLIHAFKTMKINVKAIDLNDHFLLNLIFKQMQFQKLI